MTKKRVILGVIFLIIIVGTFFGLANLHKMIFPKTPAMPAEKSVSAAALTPAPNPIIEKVLQKRKEKEAQRTKEDILMENLEKKLFRDHGINVFITRELPSSLIVHFLEDLLKDKESLAIFKQFGDVRIGIGLSKEYDIKSYIVWVDARDGVKKVTRWLQEGKVE